MLSLCLLLSLPVDESRRKVIALGVYFPWPNDWSERPAVLGGNKRLDMVRIECEDLENASHR